jgi:SRSO17 transposase
MQIHETPVNGSVEELGPLTIVIVNKTELEPLWNEMIRKHHYLGFGKMIGQSIKYLILVGKIPLAALSFNRAMLHVGVRDAYIGWTNEGRKQNLKYVVANHRYLILPWVKVKNLASHILGACLRKLPGDWENLYGYRPNLVETFVDGERYEGTCYLASNWTLIGETKGYGKVGRVFEHHGRKKKVFIYELSKGFIKTLSPHLRRIPQSDQWEDVKMMLQVPDWNPKLIEEAGLNEETLAEMGNRLFDYICEYKNCFANVPQLKHALMYIKGLLSDITRKNIENIVERYGDLKEIRTLQAFMKDAQWDEGKVLTLYQQKLGVLISDEDGMFTIDGCDIPKYGKESVGAASQYCGISGKTTICQATVMVGYSSNNGYGLIEERLYLPKLWFSDEYKSKWDKCKIPEKTQFRTKNELATILINKIYDSGVFQGKYVGVDAAFGHDKNFLDAIPKGLCYVADVHSSDKFYLVEPIFELPQWGGRGRKPTKEKCAEDPGSVESIVKDNEDLWQPAKFSYGSKGPVVGKDMSLRVLDVRNGRPNDWVWLYARKVNNGDLRYAVSNLPEETPIEKLRELANRRWAIEQCFKEGKSSLGLDHYEGRSFDGFHRHLIFVFLAHLFLLGMRKEFSVDYDRLSPMTREILKETGTHTKGKVPIFTCENMRGLITFLVLNPIEKVSRCLRILNRDLHNYSKTFISHWKKYFATVQAPEQADTG